MSFSRLQPIPEVLWDPAAAAHLLNRAGFGGSPAEIARLHAGGLNRAVLGLLDFSQPPVPHVEPAWAQPDPSRAEKLRAFRQATEEKRQELRREEQREQRRHLLEFHHAWLRRMAGEGAPLEEKLTLFWHGHFATSTQKVKDASLMCRQNSLFRHHAAGQWSALLAAVTSDPAMLLYLDQADSKPGHPNENYARELMELFTLGEGNFSEVDVVNAARALTGLSYDRLHQEAIHRRRLRDSQPKTLFGQTGDWNEADVIRIITQQAASARFITTKLWIYFAGTEPDPGLVSALAAEFERHGQEFKPFLNTLFRSAAFYAPEVRRQQIKSPVQLLVGACRQLERELPPPPVAHNSLRQLGQELFNPPNVKGWDGGIAWINTTTLLARHQLAAQLTLGGNPPTPPRRAGAPARPLRERFQSHPAVGVSVEKLFMAQDRQSPDALVRAVEQRLFQAPLHEPERVRLLDYVSSQSILDSRALQGLLHLAMCTPDYQLT